MCIEIRKEGLCYAGKSQEAIRPVLIADQETLSSQYVFLQHLFVGLAAESCTTALVCPAQNLTGLLPAGPVELITYTPPAIPGLWRRNDDRLLAALRQFKPTVLHSLSTGKALLTRRFARRLDVPYVVTFNSLKRQLLRGFVSSKRCAAVITYTPAVALKVAKTYPALSNRIEQINMGTFAEDKCVCFPEPGRTASLVIVRPLRCESDFEPLLNAIKHLVIEGYELMVVIIGTGRAEQRIRKLLRNLGLWQIVNIIANVRSLRSVFSGADIYVQPQPAPAFDGNMLQAMSVGMAVAACASRDDELALDGQTAVVFDPADELSIYAALQRILDRPQFARQIASNAQQQIREKYSVSKMVSAFLNTYRNASQWPIN